MSPDNDLQLQPNSPADSETQATPSGPSLVTSDQPAVMSPDTPVSSAPGRPKIKLFKNLLATGLLVLTGLLGALLLRTVTTKNTPVNPLWGSACSATPAHAISSQHSGESQIEPIPNYFQQKARKLCPLKEDTQLSMTVALVQPNEAAITQEADSVSDPSSPNYRKFLTPQQYEEQYGVPRAETDTVKAWLTTVKLSPTAPQNESEFFDVTARASTFEKAFGTSFDVICRGDDTQAYGNVSPLYAPSSVAKYIEGVIGSDNVAEVRSSHIPDPKPDPICQLSTQQVQRPTERQFLLYWAALLLGLTFVYAFMRKLIVNRSKD